MEGERFLGRQLSAWEVLGVHDQSPWQSSPRECGGQAQRPPAGRPISPPRLASPCPSAGPEWPPVALWLSQAAREDALTRAVRSANSLNRTITLIAVCADSCFSHQLGSDSGTGITHPTGRAEQSRLRARDGPAEGLGTARPPNSAQMPAPRSGGGL